MEVSAVPFLELVHPDDIELTVNELKRLGAGIDTMQFENRCRCKDGSWRWLSWTCPAPRAGSDLLYAVARDVTERKRSRHG